LDVRASRPDPVTPWESAPGTHRIGGCGGPRIGLYDEEKGREENNLSLLGLELRPPAHIQLSNIKANETKAGRERFVLHGSHLSNLLPVSKG
jgi:hypothetical protein